MSVFAASSVQAQTAPPETASIKPLRPPSVPLIAHDPYFSVWSNSDQLAGSATRHWTGKPQTLSSLLRLDEKTYRLMGDTPTALPVLSQTGVEVLPTRTIYSFQGEGVVVKLTFTSPLLPTDLDLLSRPVTYLTWEVTATDGKNHDAALYLDASSSLAVNLPNQQVNWSRENVSKLTALKIGSVNQPVLQKRGDDLRIDWGHLYLAAPRSEASFAIGNNAALEQSFVATGALPAKDDSTGPRAVQDGEPVAALVMPLRRVGAKATTRHALLAYDDGYSIQFMGRNLRPYWRRKGADARSLLSDGENDYAGVMKRCVAFDAELKADLTRTGGEKYARLAALSYRQSWAAQKLVADDKGQPLSFSKENNSNGCIATVDVLYPAAPQMLALSPSLLKASLQPIMMYAASERWKFPFAPHDIGTYPKANGQVYGDGENGENNQMPVEETGNMLILMAALAKTEGNAKFSDPFWPTMTKWADYLALKGFDPENQLCTDDFAGHLAHNVNLSAKAIVALGAYAQMAQMRGETASAQKYRALAEKFAVQWGASAYEGDHARLAFDRPNSWSQKYNLVWDSILGMNLFPAAVYENEMSFYRRHLNVYGLPLDSRRSYTKLDWQVWTATLTGRRDDFDALVAPLYDWMSATTSRVPMTDWYDTKTGTKEGFQARSVVGGVFLPMLKDAKLWKKWTSRDKMKPANWAPLPVPPVITEVVPTGKAQLRVAWKYTLVNPEANWMEPTYSDVKWQKGEAGFGTPQTPSIKINTPWTSKDIWLRRTFNWSGDVKEPVKLYGFHDDAAEVYLNGTLVATLEGYNSSYEVIAALPADAIKAGENVLAVHCHQDAGGQGVDIGLAQVK